MKQTINIHQFRNAFARAGREDNFSYEGQEALFDWLETYEEDTGEEIELDVIALCCDFTEFSNPEDAANYYDLLFPIDVEEDDEEEKWRWIIDWLQDRTTVIEFDSGIIIQDF
jgi:hypothetical protein